MAAGFGLILPWRSARCSISLARLYPASPTALIGTFVAALWAWIGVGEVPASATFIGGTIVFRRVLGRLLIEQRSVRAVWWDDFYPRGLAPA